MWSSNIPVKGWEKPQPWADNPSSGVVNQFHQAILNAVNEQKAIPVPLYPPELEDIKDILGPEGVRKQVQAFIKSQWASFLSTYSSKKRAASKEWAKPFKSPQVMNGVLEIRFDATEWDKIKNKEKSLTTAIRALYPEINEWFANKREWRHNAYISFYDNENNSLFYQNGRYYNEKRRNDGENNQIPEPTLGHVIVRISTRRHITQQDIDYVEWLLAKK